jgi:hypothetical protein
MEFLESISETLLDPKSELEWVPLPGGFDFSLPLNFGVYIKDAFTDEGVSGGAIVELNKNIIYAHSQPTWSVIESGDLVDGVLLMPFQVGESQFFEDNHLPNLPIPVRLKLNDFFNEGNVRFALFEISYILKRDLDTFKSVESALRARKDILKKLPNS